MAKRKLFEEMWAGSGSTRIVMRAQVEFYFGIEDIACAVADRYHEFERAEDMLSIRRRRAIELTKASFHDRGMSLSEVGVEEVLKNWALDLTLDGKEASLPAFVGALLLHVKKLFPELV